MNRIVLLADRPRSIQIVGVIVVPAIFGVIAGLVLGASAPIYWILQVIAAIGGLMAGMEHLSPRDAARRGAFGGLIYGAFLLAAHAISGAEAEADIGDPEIALVAVTTIGGVLLGAAGAGLRSRSR